jgi:hypothetical protein
MSQNERKAEFVGYLSDTFGKEILKRIRVPINVNYGERVIYVLSENETVSRVPSSGPDTQLIEKIAAETGGLVGEVKPAVESGFSEPRLVDLPGWDICFEIPLMEYFVLINNS